MSEEKCPKCGNKEYRIDDYNDDFDQDGGAQWWTCTCSKCGCRFTITTTYKYLSTTVEADDDEDEDE